MDALSTTGGSGPGADAPVLPPLPAESPLEMRVQALGHGRVANPTRPTTPPNMAWRRFAVIGGAALLTLVATYQMWWLLRGDGIDPLEGTLLVLFVALFAWIVQAFAGFVLLLQRRPLRMGMSAHGPLPAVSARTALLMPIYNEDPERLVAGLQAMHESLADTGQLGCFDFFVLSDTRDPDIQAAEAAAFMALRERLGPDARAYYRLREDNNERKAGNIADWVRRGGGAWPQFLILDADSVMDGGTIVRLAAAMERHDDVALIQTLPVIVNGNTLFARMQQFAGRVYGPVIAYGVAWWHGAESNYWGHNAMIRGVEALTAALEEPRRPVAAIIGGAAAGVPGALIANPMVGRGRSGRRRRIAAQVPTRRPRDGGTPFEPGPSWSIPAPPAPCPRTTTHPTAARSNWRSPSCPPRARPNPTRCS